MVYQTDAAQFASTLNERKQNGELILKTQFIAFVKRYVGCLQYLYQGYINCQKTTPFCLPFGKADDTPSSALPGVRSSLLRLHPWTP
jgi:hypothetical protein